MALKTAAPTEKKAVTARPDRLDAQRPVPARLDGAQRTDPIPTGDVWGGADVRAAVMKGVQLLGAPVPALTPPPAGHDVKALSGDSSAIGLPSSFFDPKASYETNLAKLKAHGVPRYPALAAPERAHEAAFADEVQQDPEYFMFGAMLMTYQTKGPSIVEVDGMKRMYPGWGCGDLPENDVERHARAESNHALHPTATALARLALLRELDKLAELPEGDPRKQVLVTSGGTAAGKIALLELVKRQEGNLPFGTVYDAAGEGDAAENAWILEAALARGVKAVFGYAEITPLEQYPLVLNRGERTGRIVDVVTYANSYVEGAKNMRALLDSPAFQAAQAKGVAAAFGVHTGRFTRAGADTEYPEAYPLGDDGHFTSADVPEVPSTATVIAAAVKALETVVKARREAGQSVDDLLLGAMSNAVKLAC